MNLCRTFRAFTSLALDALEGLGWLFAFDDVADVMWSESGRGGGNDVSQGAEPSSGADRHADSRDHESSSPAHGSAGDEPSGGSVPVPDVEPPLGFQSMAEVADRIDIDAQ